MPTSRSRRLLALLAVTAAQTATAAAADPCASMAFPYTLAGADNAERVANLRQAIICANTNTTADVIDLGGHTLAFDDGPYIAGDDSANALPVVTGGLTLKNGELRRSEAAVAAPAEFRFLYYLPVQANSSQIIEGVTFRHGVAAVGGAIMSFEGKLEVLDSTFIGNQAHELGYGGAIYARDRLDLRGSLLQGNEAVSGGGAVNGAAVEVRDTRFENNTTGHFGGGLRATYAVVAGVQFKDNQADSGGGLYAAVDAVVTNTRFTGNQATNSAGGMAYDGKAVVVNSRFEGNKAGPGGGGAIGNAATLAKGVRVINSLFAGNTATGPGTIYSGSGFTGFSAEFINITASGNGQAGVPLFFSNLSSNAIRNSIVWGNTGEIGAPIITHSLVQGGFAGTGNIEGDPHFTDAAGGNYRLGDGSPAIDAGDNSEVPADTQDVNGDSNLTEPVPDLDGHPRLYDDTGVADTGVGSAPLVDMGAFERQSSSMPPVQAIPTPVPALSPWTAALLAGLLGWLASGWKRRLKG